MFLDGVALIIGMPSAPFISWNKASLRVAFREMLDLFQHVLRLTMLEAGPILLALGMREMSRKVIALMRKSGGFRKSYFHV